MLIWPLCHLTFAFILSRCFRLCIFQWRWWSYGLRSSLAPREPFGPSKIGAIAPAVRPLIREREGRRPTWWETPTNCWIPQVDFWLFPLDLHIGFVLGCLWWKSHYGQWQSEDWQASTHACCILGLPVCTCILVDRFNIMVKSCGVFFC